MKIIFINNCVLMNNKNWLVISGSYSSSYPGKVYHVYFILENI